MAISTYELFLPRGTLSNPKSLSKRLNAIQVFRRAMKKVSSRMEDDFEGPQRWIVVINQPCLHSSYNSPKNRYRMRRQLTSKENRKRMASVHYTAYGYLCAASASSHSNNSNKSGPVFLNRWWMHVNADKHVDYAPHPRRGKMWKKKIYGREIVPLAGPFEF